MCFDFFVFVIIHLIDKRTFIYDFVFQFTSRYNCDYFEMARVESTTTQTTFSENHLEFLFNGLFGVEYFTNSVYAMETYINLKVRNICFLEK